MFREQRGGGDTARRVEAAFGVCVGPAVVLAFKEDSGRLGTLVFAALASCDAIVLCSPFLGSGCGRDSLPRAVLKSAGCHFVPTPQSLI